MEDGTEVHAQFYAQPWDKGSATFVTVKDANGNNILAKAVYIGEAILDNPVPAFCGDSTDGNDACAEDSAPLNWDLASVTWDTSGMETTQTTDMNYKFWVVVWMQKEDENGKSVLMSEIPGHGLGGIPPVGADQQTSLTDIEIETYSNNLGFYNQVFFLGLSSNSVTQGAETSERDLLIDVVELLPYTVLRDQVTAILVHHRASGSRLDHVPSFFYEGDPEAGGTLLDMDIIPRIPEESPFVVRFPYTPETCGPHTLFVRTVPRGGIQTEEVMFDVDVTLDPVAQTRILIERVKSLGLRRGVERSLLAKLKAAKRSFQRGNLRAGLNKLRAFGKQLRPRGWEDDHGFSNHFRAPGREKVPSADVKCMIARIADLKSCL
jgi:hypothetical protein